MEGKVSISDANVFNEPAPSTVLYRQSSNTTRPTLSSLLDQKRAFAEEIRRGSGTGIEEEGFPPETSFSNRSADELAEGHAVGGDAHDASPSKRATPTKLNWKNGVLIPCLLNIWGVIMFLRLGWVVGQAGIFQGTLIIIASNVVTTITALSMCAICTNGEVSGGGAYYLISRSLGPVFGGMIGLLFFVAQAVATSMYVVGFAEAVVDIENKYGDGPFTGDPINDIRVIGLCCSVLLLCVALVGVGWYAKCQVGLLCTLVVSMVTVVIGSFLPDVPSRSENTEAGFVEYAWRNWEPDYSYDPLLPTVKQNFFSVFAVFFPAVTGVMAGANMSGDLDDPSRAIPKGTLLAIAVTFVTYVLLLWILGTSCERCADAAGENFCPINGSAADVGWADNANHNDEIPNGGLLYNKLIMENMAAFGPLLYVGVFAATLSSALASLVGAPRILQSVANDRLFPWPWFNYFAAGRGADNEPVRAYVLTFVITVLCVLIAKLDIIAPLISNFFMVSYAITNYACFATTVAEAPGWRPSFKYYDPYLSFTGAVLCVVVMFLMDWSTALITILVCVILYRYLKYVAPSVNWGAAGEARKYVNALHTMETLQHGFREHAKTFRPQPVIPRGWDLVRSCSRIFRDGSVSVVWARMSGFI